MCKLFVWFSLFSLHLLYHKSTEMSSGAILLGLVRRHYLRDLFETAVTPANADTKLIGIVKEETAAYFAGAQTLDRTVEVISDRVKTRLAE